MAIGSWDQRSEFGFGFLWPVACPLFPVPCGLSPVPCPLFPVPCGLSPVPSISPSSRDMRGSPCMWRDLAVGFGSCRPLSSSCDQRSEFGFGGSSGLSPVPCHLSPVPCHLWPVTCPPSISPSSRDMRGSPCMWRDLAVGFGSCRPLSSSCDQRSEFGFGGSSGLSPVTCGLSPVPCPL